MRCSIFVLYFGGYASKLFFVFFSFSTLRRGGKCFNYSPGGVHSNYGRMYEKQDVEDATS